MSTTKSFFFALALSAFGAAGCGGDSVPVKTVDLAEFLVPDAAEAPDFARVCVASCSSDAQCQNTCAAPSSGISCCDTTTNTCYTNSASICPAPPDMSIPTSY